MHLSVTCPQCLSKYQLDPSMRGKRMRCPNTLCRAVIDVRDDHDPPPAVTETPAPLGDFPGDDEMPSAPPPKITPQTWQPEAPAAPKQEPAPPVMARPAPPKVKPEAPKKPPPEKPKPDPAPIADFPDDFPGDDGALSEPAPTIATEAWQPETPKTPPSATVESPPRPRRTALWVILAMLLVLGVSGGVGYWQVRTGIESNEAELLQKAESLYKQHEFANASAAFQKMQRDFPDSANQKKYRFLGELSDVRKAVQARESPDETVKSLERVLQFTSVYQGEPLLKEYASDLWETLDFLAWHLTRLAESEKSPPFVAYAQRAWSATKKYTPPPSASPADRERKLQDEWTRVDGVLASHFERQSVIAVLKKNAERATQSAVAEAWRLVEKTKRQDDPEIRTLMSELFKAHREQVTFVAADNAAKTPMVEEDALPSLSVTPSLKAERAVNVSGSPILSLARGVLYSLEPTKGELLWARRVGIDTRVPPLRVPADAITPELLLVMSSDQRSISGVVAQTGEAIWTTPLTEACLGTPVLVDRQVLVATLAGRIDEIEIAEGRRLGSYHVGQPLTLGGVRQPGSSLVYFPADEFCLYAIDVKERICTNILYTRHAAGSLTGLPTMLADEKGGWLLWSQATGLDKTVVRPFALPIKEHDQKSVEPILTLAGMTAPPWPGADRLAMVTDTGMLSIWGIRQKGARDPLLFPWLPRDFAIDASRRSGRCDVVHADAETIWTLVRGKLQRIETGFHPSTGPHALARWSQPVALGNLLHAAHVSREPDGRVILFLTTQADDRATCLASAVDGESGKILWQRQLGIIPQDRPRLIGGQIAMPGPEGILRFQPTADKTPAPWRRAGDWLLQESWTGSSRLLLKRDAGFVQLSWKNGDTKLIINIGAASGDEKTTTRNAVLPAAIQGTPALGDGFVLLPLANGILVRLNLSDASNLNGPDWRAIGAEEQAQGHIVLLGGADFLVTDGSRGLQRIHSDNGKAWDKRAAVQLSHRITVPPALIIDEGGDKTLIGVLDASDTVTLMDAERLNVVRRWPMPGKVTAGPFVRAGKIGCVVGMNRLVWLDPAKDEPAWEYAFVADIVGEPRVIDGVLVVGDAAGQFIGLDPSSGRALGAGLTLKANVAPTAAPLPYGVGRAFVPLTDGTIVVLPLEKLRQKED